MPAKTFTEVIIANDALAVIVNPSNKINQLTREQTGKYLYRQGDQLERGRRR